MRVPWAAIPRRMTLATALLAVLAASCVRPPGAVAPPQQRDAHFEDSAIEAPFVDMRQSNTADYVVKDIDEPGGGFRWTHAAPELRFALYNTRRLDLVADIGMVVTVLDAVGPLTVSVDVNGHPLLSETCSKPELYRLRGPVPPEWLNPRTYNRVAFRTGRIYTSTDGVKLGFVLYRAGFVARD